MNPAINSILFFFYKHGHPWLYWNSITRTKLPSSFVAVIRVLCITSRCGGVPQQHLYATWARYVSHLFILFPSGGGWLSAIIPDGNDIEYNSTYYYDYFYYYLFIYDDAVDVKIKTTLPREGEALREIGGRETRTQ